MLSLLVLLLGNRRERNKRIRYEILFLKFYSSPSGEVTIIVTGKNYSIPDFQIPFAQQINNNLTIGPYSVSFNQTNVVAIQSS